MIVTIKEQKVELSKEMVDIFRSFGVELIVDKSEYNESITIKHIAGALPMRILHALLGELKYVHSPCLWDYNSTLVMIGDIPLYRIFEEIPYSKLITLRNVGKVSADQLRQQLHENGFTEY